MASLSSLRVCRIPQRNRENTGSVIFLHGSGDTGEGLKYWVNELVHGDMDFDFPHIQVLFPTAPEQPYTAAMGLSRPVWFDRERIALNAAEKIDSVNVMMKQLSQLVNAEVSKGIPEKRIVLGGFSMGGTMAMHLAYRRYNKVAGVFSLSSFLNENSEVYKAMKSNDYNPPLFMSHGINDSLVKYNWGQNTYAQIRKVGVKTEFYSYPGMGHELNGENLKLLKSWISERVPEIPDVLGAYSKNDS